MTAPPDDGFREYVVARSPALLRTAYLLTGDRADADELLQAALARTALARGRLRDREALDEHVRRLMVTDLVSSWRRRARRVLGRRPAVEADPHDPLWAALSRLPAAQRAAVVLCLYEDLPPAVAARLLGVTVPALTSTLDAALAAVRAQVPSPVPLPEQPSGHRAGPVPVLRPDSPAGAL